MITRRTFASQSLVGTVLAGASLAACGKSSETQDTGGRGDIRFSVLSADSAQSMGDVWKPILADMEAATGLKVTPYFSSNYALLIEALKYHKTDAGWFSNQSGLEAIRRANGEVFARTTDPSGVDGYKSVIIVPAKSKTTLDDLLKCNKSLTFGLGDAISTSGTLAPMTYLFAPKGIDPNQCFKQVRSGASHQTNLFAVASSQLDAATNNSTSIKLNREKGGHEADEVRVIWESPPLPEDPIIWRKDLDPAIKEKLRQFFLTYGVGNTPVAQRQRADMAKLNVGGFKPADNSHLLPVREMEATEQWLEAKKGGDAAKIANAKANLDSITAERQALEARTGQAAGTQ